MYSRGCYKITVFSYEVTARFLHSNPNCYNPETEDGEGICYEYDQDDLRIKILYPNGVIERIKYDAKGNIIKKIRPEQYDKKTNGGPKNTYEYDEMERLVRKSASGRTHLSMSYDKNGNCIRRGDVSGKVTEYQFNSLDLLEKVWDDGKELAGYEYNADGTIHVETHGLVSKQYQYDLDKKTVPAGLRMAGKNGINMTRATG